MSDTRIRKALRDLLNEKSRTALAAAAIAVGVMAAGASLTSASILTRELSKGFLATNPATASLFVSGIPGALMAELRALPQIADAEIRDRIDARVKVGDNVWKNIWIYVVEDFSDMRIAKIFPQEGKWPAGDGEILFERQSFRVAALPIGREVTIRLPDGRENRLLLAGSVHDIGTAPAWMENLAYGYVTRRAAESLGASADQRELKLISAGNAMDREHNRDVAASTAQWLAARGVSVYRTEVPVPGRHVHADQMQSLLFLMEGFGVLSLLLGCLLIVTLMSSLMARQVRQIAVMKAIGGSLASIRGIYFGMLAVLGAIAFLIGAPAGLMAGKAYAYMAANQLNFIITDASVGWYVFALQAAVALLLTLLVAAFPIARGTSRSIREALSDYGLRDSGTGDGILARMVSAPFSSDRPMLVTVRNVFRRRGRFVRALIVLAAGGAVFMTGMNLRTALRASTKSYFDGLLYDVGLILDKPYALERLEETLGAVPGVRGFDYGMRSQAQILNADGTRSVTMRVSAIPLPSESLRLPMVSGRWLDPLDTSFAVVNTRFMEAAPGLMVGAEVGLAAGGSESRWKIVGVASEAAAAGIYVPYGSLPSAARGTANEVRVFLSDRGPVAGTEAKKLIEAAFSRAHIGITAQVTMAESRKIIDDHLVVITVFLTSMSAFMIVVGFLGLASALSLNALERRREIGVMRALGALPGRVMAIVMSEGLIVSALSWLLGILVSIPLSVVLGRMLGAMLLNDPLGFAANPAGLGLWLAAAALIGSVSGFFPGLSAARANLRETLAYE